MVVVSFAEVLSSGLSQRMSRRRPAVGDRFGKPRRVTARVCGKANGCGGAVSRMVLLGKPSRDSVRPQATQLDQVDVAKSVSVETARQRSARLKNLVYLRRLYRNLVRAEGYGATSLGVYYKASDDERADMTDEEKLIDEEAKRQHALNVLADMQLTAEQLKSDLRYVLPVYEDLLRGVTWNDRGSEEGGSNANQSKTQRIKRLVMETMANLLQRVEDELPLLPFETAREARIALGRILTPEGEEVESGKVISYPGRLELLEKVAGQFFSDRVQPTVRKAKDVIAEQGVKEAFSSSRAYMSGLWRRLNGQGRRDRERLPYNLPIPASSRSEFQKRVEALSMRIDKLEKNLVEVSKTREQRLRGASIERRAVMAFEMRDMDQQVMDVGRELALCSLEVQAEYIYMAVEDEARQVLDAETEEGGGGKGLQAAPRRGSTQELAILVAEYSMLAERLAELWDVFQAQDKQPIFTPAFDQELTALAAEIPDMRARIGIPDQDVFGGNGLSLRKAQIELKSNMTKVKEGVSFFALGIKMLGTDLGYAGRLFMRAALGNTLTPREVSALRRTLRDIFTFVPFTIILIIPMTPLGHVLVFGFIQRYFPNFFPSQFNTRRQEMVKRYDELRLKLDQAQEAAFQREEEEELERKAAELARLTAAAAVQQPRIPAVSSTMQTDAPAAAPVHKELIALQQEVEDANLDALTYPSGDDAPDEGTDGDKPAATSTRPPQQPPARDSGNATNGSTPITAPSSRRSKS